MTQTFGNGYSSNAGDHIACLPLGTPDSVGCAFYASSSPLSI
jgi:hypothetical protein